MNKNQFGRILIFLIFICFSQGEANQKDQNHRLVINHQLVQKKAKKDQPKTLAIDQGNLLDKMEVYLKINQRDIKVLEDKGGVCNGLAFLVQYYGSRGKQEEFFQAIESIIAWDGQKESLKKPCRLSSYKNLGELFEHWVNDIIWFQQSYIKLNSIQTFEYTKQRRRIKQFQLIKKNEKEEISMISSPIDYLNLNQKQLEEILQIWSNFPNTVLEFVARRHATSARILEDGKIFYYDPNSPKRLAPFESPKELAKTIRKLYGFTNEMNIAIMAYRFIDDESGPFEHKNPQLALDWKVGKESPNGLTSFHTAIFFNEIKTFNALLKQSNSNPNQADKSGITPLFLATQLWRPDFLKKLLESKKVEVNQKCYSHLSPLMAAIASLNIDAAELLFKHGANLFLTSQGEGLDQIVENPGKILDIPATLIACMKEEEELEFMRELCRRVPKLVNMQDARGNTLSYYAALLENQDLMDLLDEASHWN